MNKKMGWFVGLVVIFLGILGVWYFVSTGDSDGKAKQTSSTKNTPVKIEDTLAEKNQSESVQISDDILE